MKGTLTDTGPLFASIYERDDRHNQAREGIKRIVLPMHITWPCFAEIMHFLGKHVGWRGQSKLLESIRLGDVSVLGPNHYPVLEIGELMERYRDAPMGLADASLVLSAESLKSYKVFTFDEHFHAYRTRNRRALEVIP